MCCYQLGDSVTHIHRFSRIFNQYFADDNHFYTHNGQSCYSKSGCVFLTLVM